MCMKTDILRKAQDNDLRLELLGPWIEIYRNSESGLMKSGAWEHVFYSLL
jgi:hypothetical protein